LLKAELRRLGSLLMACADRTAVPAGKALAVDRELFARCVTDHIEGHPLITIIREEVTEIPDRPCIIASGPLTSDALAAAIQCGGTTGRGRYIAMVGFQTNLKWPEQWRVFRMIPGLQNADLWRHSATGCRA